MGASQRRVAKFSLSSWSLLTDSSACAGNRIEYIFPWQWEHCNEGSQSSRFVCKLLLPNSSARAGNRTEHYLPWQWEHRNERSLSSRLARDHLPPDSSACTGSQTEYFLCSEKHRNEKPLPSGLERKYRNSHLIPQPMLEVERTYPQIDIRNIAPSGCPVHTSSASIETVANFTANAWRQYKANQAWLHMWTFSNGYQVHIHSQSQTTIKQTYIQFHSQWDNSACQFDSH